MSEIRSVSVHLDADVAGYIAKMRLAGAETDKAFSRGSAGITSTNSKLGETESALNRVDSAAVRVERTLSRSNSSGNGWSKATKSVDGFLGKIGLLPVLATAGTAALIPLAAAATGVVAAFAAPIAFVGAGATLFGFLGGEAIKTTQKQYQEIDTLSKKLQGLTKGGTAYKQTLMQLHAAQKQLGPDQVQFHNALETLSFDFKSFIRGPVGQDLLKPFTQGLKIADDLLPKSGPIVRAFSNSLSGLLGELDKYANTPGFDHFIHAVARQGGHDLTQFGHIIGDITPGLGRLLVLLGRRLSPELMREVDHLAQGFSQWAQSRGARQDVQSFIDYLHQVGPGVAHTVASLARALVHVVEALAPLGPPTLRVIQGIADAISSIPVPVLTALAAAFVGASAFQKIGGVKAIGALGSLAGLGKGGGPLGGGSVPGVGGGVVPVFVTNPGFGGPGGGVPGEPGVPGTPGSGGRLGKIATGAALAVPTYAITAAVDAAVHSAVQSVLGKQAADLNSVANHTLLGVPTPGVNTSILPTSVSNAIAGAIKAGFASLNHGGGSNDQSGTAPNKANLELNTKPASDAVDSVTSHVKALQQHLGQASQGMDLVGHSAQRSLGGQAAAATQHLSDKLNTIKAGPASAAFDAVGHSAAANSARAASSVDNVQHHINSLHGKNVSVNVDGGQSLATLREIAALEASLRSKTITVTTLHTTGGSSKMGNAAGGYITGPGSATSDSIPAWLSNGEFVMRAAAVQRYGVHMMQRMNAMRFASGGSAGSTSSSGNGITPGSAADHHLRSEAAATTHNLHDLNKALADATKLLSKEQQQRQALIQQEQQLAQAVEQNFRSAIFGTQNVWGQAQDPLSILRTDVRNVRRYRTDIRSLRRRGLSGGALAEVTSLADAQQLMGSSPHYLRELSQEYALRQRLSRAAGQQLGQYRYDKAIDHMDKVIARQHETVKHIHEQIKAANHHLATINHSIQHEGPAATAKGINSAASTAQRRRH